MTKPPSYLVVNTDTGECFERKPRKIKRTEAFYMTCQKDSVELAKKKLTGMEFRILFYLAGVMDYDNRAYVSQAFLAKELGSTEATICAAMKRLEGEGLVFKSDLHGKKFFVVSDQVATRGKVKL